MDFLTKNAKTIKNGNLALTSVLVAGILGMTGYLVYDFRAQADDLNPPQLLEDGQISYEGDEYITYASMFTILVVSAICMGILFSKVNNEYIKSDYLESTVMFIVPLIALIMACLASIPFSNDEDTTNGANRQISYDITAIVLISLLVGVASHHSRVFQHNHLLGTGLFLTLAVVAMSLLAYMYHLLVTTRDKADYTGDLSRQLNTHEKNVLIATLSFAGIVVVGGLLHIYMERSYFKGLTGRKSPTRKSPREKLLLVENLAVLDLRLI